MSRTNRKSFQPSFDALENRLTPAVVHPLTNGILRISGDNTAETMRISQNSGRIYLQGSNLSYNAASIKEIIVDAGGGNDVVDLRGVTIKAAVNGGSGHDILMGGENNDVLVGGTGEDRLFGMGGSDTLRGGDQDDRIFGGSGYDYLYGGYGTDFMDDDNITGHEFYADENDGYVDFIADMVTPASGAKVSHVDQQGSSTCAFLATLAGLARSGVNMSSYIQYTGHDANGVGKYNVFFQDATGRRVTVPVQFEGHTSSLDASRTTDYASWTIIMNRAWLKVHGDRGATPDSCMRALGLRTMDVNKFTDTAFNTIANATAKGNVVVASTKASPVSRLVGGHAYTIMQAGLLNGQRMVQVRNPWGRDGATPSDNNANDGLIWLSWSQFAASMSYVSIGGR